MRNRAYRREIAKCKDERLRRIVMNGRYNPHAGYVEYELINGECLPKKYIKYPKNSKKQHFFKRASNRKVRSSSVPKKGNGYRKCREYWREIY